jgi:ADP-heptose:LPS heptosyltransferase
VSRVLLVRLSSIGDVVHTLPTAAALAGSGFETCWLVEPAARPLLEGNPVVTRVVAAPASRGFRWSAALRAVGELRSSRADVALELQGLWKSAAWARLSGARRVVGFGGPWRREPASAWLLNESVPLPAEARHVIDKNLVLLRSVGVEAVGSRAFSFPEARHEASIVERRLSEAGLGDFVVLNPGGGWASKLWPAERFGRLAQRLGRVGVRCLVTWGPGERSLADRVVSASEGAASACFETTLLDLLAVLRRARLVVAGDTGPLHMACALGRPAVGIYGPTDPERNGPFADGDRVVRRAPSCAPCHKRRCPVHDDVMATIPVEEVHAAIHARLAAREGSPVGV